ncbi:hypothetical protein DAPK24_041440 [Pichia kluyveri]|uniref:Spindle pole body component Bbp1 C-terminal domain-containing protein n=1 Tax=Pichia kluyveri TaxID=36015 RepID=A0AAV5RAA0_PICKL|nr:hypothetical protein DAPK24_041440 [Pichia kluyveri]
MFEGITTWIRSGRNKNSANLRGMYEDLSSMPNIPDNGDVYLSDDELRKIHERIRKCIDDDQYVPIDDTVDNTLRIMREEIDKWYKPVRNERNEKNEEFEQIRRLDSSKNINLDDFNIGDAENNELLSYCIRLENNNEYLLQLIEKFEQLSFKKRYSELLMMNENLQKEYNRLKSTNGKVYSSYCDLLEEVKKRQEENKMFKEQIKNVSKNNDDKSMKLRKLQIEIDKLKRENERNENKITDLRKSNNSFQRTISEKEDEIIKLKGTVMITKLKLERAEKIIFPPTKVEEARPETPVVTPVLEPVSTPLGIDENKPLESSTPEKEIDDTIAQLHKKYQTKSKIIT